MIRFQSQKIKLPSRSTAGKRVGITKPAFLAAVALVAQTLAGCSFPQSLPETGVAAQYPDLNDRPPMADARVDQVAQIKAELMQVRDDQERVAAQQRASH
jgi:hypothetical protein